MTSYRIADIQGPSASATDRPVTLRTRRSCYCIGSEGVAARSRKKFRKKVAHSLEFIRNSSAHAFLTASRRIHALREGQT
jgi:hypothetical protein